MERIILEAEIRRESGKGAARRLRAAGRLPAVLYGHREVPQMLSVESKAFQEAHAQSGGNAIICLQVSGGEQNCDTVVKAVENGRIRKNPLHVDFQRVYMNEPIKAVVPIHVTGEAPGVKLGGVVQHSLWELEVEALPQELPQGIEVDISGLEMGASLLVSDLKLAEKVTVLTDQDSVVVSVTAPHTAASVNAALEEAAPGQEAAATEGKA
ncbi:MAG: 50S ribosomal protein L25 [bacterium]|nr:50S ribosomal protein L25 [bacterium]